MFSTKDCVPGGTLPQLIAGEVPSPGAAPGAAWLNLTGICPPSGKPVTVSVIAGGGGAPPRCPPGAWAAAAAAIAITNIETISTRAADIVSLLTYLPRQSRTPAR